MATREDLKDRFGELRTSLDALPEVSEPPKSMLRILGSARSERNWNTLLAYFLDPSQPHGFDADLLKAFLDVAQQESDAEIEYYHRDLETVQVDTEATSPQNNRPDIVIRAPGEWFVCIESKVEATEGKRQTKRYIEDTHIGRDEKSEYPENGHYYLFLSKRFAPNSTADAFSDLYWDQVVDAFHEERRRSHGKYPERSVNQLEDYLSTITQVTNMEDDDFTTIQKEKVRLLSEYRDDIDDLFEAADSLRERAIEDWPELFRKQVDDDLWTDDWHARDDKYGCLFKDGWYLDDDHLEPTTDHEETWGNTGFRLHFIHYIRRKRSFRRGVLTFVLHCSTNVELRKEFHRLYNTDRWQDELQPVLEDRGITNKGNKKQVTRKQYEVDQSRLPESYFETLAVAFEEHLPVARVADEILAEALGNVKND